MPKQNPDRPSEPPLREAHEGGSGRSPPSGERRPEGVLDLSGLKCPLPALLARRHLARLAPGALLTLLTTDPLAVVDIPHMCGEEGHAVVDTRPADGHHIFVIRKV